MAYTGLLQFWNQLFLRPSVQFHSSNKFDALAASQVVLRLSYRYDLHPSLQSDNHKLLSNVSCLDTKPPDGFPSKEVDSVIFSFKYSSCKISSAAEKGMTSSVYPTFGFSTVADDNQKFVAEKYCLTYQSGCLQTCPLTNYAHGNPLNEDGLLFGRRTACRAERLTNYEVEPVQEFNQYNSASSEVPKQQLAGTGFDGLFSEPLNIMHASRLLDAGLRLSINENPKNLDPMVSIANLNLKSTLGQVAPALWSPGFLQV